MANIVNRSTQRFNKIYTEPYPKYSCVSYERHFMLLVGYLEQNTNRLVYRKNGTHVPLGKGDIAKELGVSQPTCWRFLDESQRRGYIVECPVRRAKPGFYVNPVYANSGEGVSVELYLLFEHDETFKKALSKSDMNEINEYLGI